jgi:histidinol-phosphate aminotransferase
MADYVEKYDNLFISRTFSKAFALANFRIGYLISQQSNIDQISIIRNSKNVTSFAQIAAIAALSDIGYMKEYVSEVNMAKNIFSSKIKSIKGIKHVYESQGNFLLIEFNTEKIKNDFYNHLEKAGVFVRNLTHSIMLKNCLRITIGKCSQMEKVKNLIENCSSHSE